VKNLAFLGAFLLLATLAVGQITYATHSYSPWSGSVAVGDFNKDGKPDVASISADQNGDGQLVVYLGAAGGTLVHEAQYSINSDNNNAWVYTADVNSDGNLDLIVSKEFAAELEMWYGNGDGTFTFGQVLPINGPSPLLAFADVDGSDTIDIITFEQNDTGTISEVYFSNGEGSFSTNTTFWVKAPAGTQNFAVADFDRDGKADILYRTRDSLQLFHGNGDGTFTLRKTSPFAAGTGTMTAGSFNKDMAMDVAVRIPNPSGTSDAVYVLLNNGAGTFTLKSTLHVGTSMDFSTQVTAGDLNNDGVMDLVLADNRAKQAVSYVLNNGDGTFGAENTAATTNGPVLLPVLRKMNHDSKTDIVAPSGSVYDLIATTGPTNCTPPGSAVLKAVICTPTNNGTVGTTFTVRAAADSPAGVVRMALFVDGTKRYEVWNDQLAKKVNLPAGKHRITVWGYDRYFGIAKTTIYATAQ
jgi:hypothetical protein